MMKIVLLRRSRAYAQHVVVGFDASPLDVVRFINRQNAVPITSIMTFKPATAKSGIIIHKDWFPRLFRPRLKRIPC